MYSERTGGGREEEEEEGGLAGGELGQMNVCPQLSRLGCALCKPKLNKLDGITYQVFSLRRPTPPSSLHPPARPVF